LQQIFGNLPSTPTSSSETMPSAMDGPKK
jgi:hypothetical protein